MHQTIGATAVPRPPTEPAPDAILDRMARCEPYTIADFEPDYECSRWTLRRRLETLHDQGEIEQKKHSNNVLTWWRPADGHDHTDADGQADPTEDSG